MNLADYTAAHAAIINSTIGRPEERRAAIQSIFTTAGHKSEQALRFASLITAGSLACPRPPLLFWIDPRFPDEDYAPSAPQTRLVVTLDENRPTKLTPKPDSDMPFLFCTHVMRLTPRPHLHLNYLHNDPRLIFDSEFGYETPLSVMSTVSPSLDFFSEPQLYSILSGQKDGHPILQHNDETDLFNEKFSLIERELMLSP